MAWLICLRNIDLISWRIYTERPIPIICIEVCHDVPPKWMVYLLKIAALKISGGDTTEAGLLVTRFCLDTFNSYQPTPLVPTGEVLS